jgi:aspartate/methionine/tyrosine aminotransferase
VGDEGDGARVTEPRGFQPPPYPYDRLDALREIASRHDGGCVDLSVGTPGDAPPQFVLDAMSAADVRGYPPGAGTRALIDGAAGWFAQRFGVEVPASNLAACVGTKELVAGLPHLLRLRDPERDTVLYPAVSYPTYAMGATLAGMRPVGVPVDERGCVRLDAIDSDDARRAACLWVNTPGNPAGGVEDLGPIVAWARDHQILVVSDECYVEFTWSRAPSTVLEHGFDGVLAVHSLSKRSNLAGIRVGFYAGDGALVDFLREVRRHAGLMPASQAQAGAAAALGDQQHVDEQRARYLGRLERMREVLQAAGIDAVLPEGGFYLWVAAPDGDGWSLATRLAEEGGVLASPGEFYGDPTRVRLAMVRPDDEIALVAKRLGAST